MKSQGEKERYTQLKSEFEKIARRDKKTFLNEQCNEIEKNSKRRKMRDLFKKTGGIKETFQAKMVTTKDRNGKDLKEEEDIKKRWQEYTEKLYKRRS